MYWTNCTVVESDAGVVSGAPVIVGTRVPVSAIFENLESGASIEQLVEWFPGVGEDQVRELLRFTANSAAA